MGLEPQRERELELGRELAWEQVPGSQVATGRDSLRGLGLEQVQQ